MPLRLSSLSILSVLVLSACAEMDDPVQTRQVVSAVVVEQDTSQQFVIELSYTTAVTTAEAVALLNNIAVVHDPGLSVAGEVPATMLARATGILYKDPRFSDLSQHVFEVTVTSEAVPVGQLVQDYRWEWIDRELIALVEHCPPGH
jgi:hypothetical protein